MEQEKMHNTDVPRGDLGSPTHSRLVPVKPEGALVNQTEPLVHPLKAYPILHPSIHPEQWHIVCRQAIRCHKSITHACSVVARAATSIVPATSASQPLTLSRPSQSGTLTTARPHGRVSGMS